MKSIFKRALEGERIDETISVKGPLGEAMTQALNIAYAKVDPITGESTPDGAALESQAQDVAVMQKLINAVNNDDAPADNVEIYAIGEQEVTPETVVEVVNDMAESKADEYVVIADAAAPQNEDGTGNTPEDVVDITDEEVVAIESGFIALEEAALEAAGKDKKEVHVKAGAFHKWLGKKPGEKITAADIEKGLKSNDPHVKKMAQFAKNFSGKKGKKKAGKKTATEALRFVVESLGGKFFTSLEEYVESLEVPENPETRQVDGKTPEAAQDNGTRPPEGNEGADGTNGPGNIDHVEQQEQQNGAAQPGAGQTND